MNFLLVGVPSVIFFLTLFLAAKIIADGWAVRSWTNQKKAVFFFVVGLIIFGLSALLAFQLAVLVKG